MDHQSRKFLEAPRDRLFANASLPFRLAPSTFLHSSVPSMLNYPFQSGPAYARNEWYIAAWGDEIGRTPISRTILDEELVFFRTAEGKVAALSGVCPHRWMALVAGQVVGDAIRCPYHGAEFNAEGRCTHLPAQARIPPNLKLRAFPVVERGPCVWIWPGDPDHVIASQLPDTESVGLGLGGWRIDLTRAVRVRARAQLLIENLFDDAHVDLVHSSTLTFPAVHCTEMIETPTTFAVVQQMLPAPTDDGVRAVFPNVESHISASLRIEMLGVGLINNVGSKTFSTDADGRSPILLGQMNFLHGITPETATTTHYFTAGARDFALQNNELSEMIMQRNERVVQEDIAILEAIESRLDRYGDVRAEVTFGSDSAAVRIRKRMQNIIAADLQASTRAA